MALKALNPVLGERIVSGKSSMANGRAEARNGNNDDAGCGLLMM